MPLHMGANFTPNPLIAQKQFIFHLLQNHDYNFLSSSQWLKHLRYLYLDPI